MKTNMLIALSAGFDWCYGSDYLKTSPKILKNDEFEMIKNLFLNSINRERYKDRFPVCDEGYMILYIWKNLEIEEYKKYLQSINSTIEYIKLAIVFTRRLRVHSSESAPYYEWYLDMKAWPEEIAVEVVVGEIEKEIKENGLKDFSEDERLKIFAFMTMVRYKNDHDPENREGLVYRTSFDRFGEMYKEMLGDITNN